MKAFFSRYPKEAAQETRTITVPQGESVPAGTYGYLEFFCADAECDCRRVVMSVVSKETESVMATLTYGWEGSEFYRNWIHDDEMARDMVGVSLEPLAPQTEYADFLLSVLREMLSHDKAYRKRIRRHYQMFKRSQMGGGF